MFSAPTDATIAMMAAKLTNIVNMARSRFMEYSSAHNAAAQTRCESILSACFPVWHGERVVT